MKNIQLDNFQKHSRRLALLKQRTFRVTDGMEEVFADGILASAEPVNSVLFVLNQRLSECTLGVRLVKIGIENAKALTTYDCRSTSAFQIHPAKLVKQAVHAGFLSRVDLICSLIPGDLRIYFDNDEYATIFCKRPGFLQTVTNTLHTQRILTVENYVRRFSGQ